MPIRVNHLVNVQTYEDTDEEDGNFVPSRDLAEERIDVFTKDAHSKFSVVAGATEALSFGDVGTIKGIYVEADADFQFRINGGSDTFQARLAGNKVRLFLEIDLTAFTIIAGAGAVLNGRYVVWGTPVA